MNEGSIERVSHLAEEIAREAAKSECDNEEAAAVFEGMADKLRQGTVLRSKADEVREAASSPADD